MGKFKLFKTTLLTGAVALSLLSLTSCGRKTVDLNKYLDITYNGYDTAGVASFTFDSEKLIKENPEAFGLDEDPSDLDILKVAYDLDEMIEGDLDKKTELSNGDKITFKWDVNISESMKEKYPVDFLNEDVVVDIVSLDEAEAFDPFANVKLSYSGIAPNGSLSISGSVEGLGELKFDADKTSGLSNGDTIKVTLSCYSGDVEEYCRNNGKIPSSVEKEFVVEGLSSYVQAIDEIPDDMQQKMQDQALDSIKANAANWNKSNSLDKAEFIGYYFLSPKEGFYTYDNNMIYCVYKVTANIKGYKEDSDKEESIKETYYTFYKYTDIMLLEDGTCSLNMSDGYLTNNRCKSKLGSNDFWFSAYEFYGYSELDSMFNDCVTKQISDYNYESTVKE